MRYLDLVREKIQTNKSEFDKNLEVVTRELFPEFNPKIWSNILFFVYTTYTNTDRMKSVIEKKKFFGLSGRIIVGWNKNIQELEKNLFKQENEEINNTIIFCLKVFAPIFTLEKINSFISELKNLQYKENSKETLRKNEYLELFEKIKSKLESSN